MWTKIIILTVILFFTGMNVDGAKEMPKPCTWGDIDFCERLLTIYVGKPDNWHEDEDKKSFLYCDLVKLRLTCLESLDCDVDNTPNSELPLNITQWKLWIEPQIENMVNLNLCSDEPKDLIKSDPRDPCSEYSVAKRCMEELSDYLKSRYAMTCVAMLKAAPCFINGRARCRIQRTTSTGFPRFINPYRTMSEEGRCRLIWNQNLFGRQEQWRIEHANDYFSYF
ncbi:uncharacterized protein [Ptychodera flava]|uniref:uncharacterized protein n=1 Tax=Ptychodera flava TaxID=63121 RepID=UPI00396A81C2